MRRALYWTALVLALALAVGGGFVAVREWVDGDGPDGAVRGYFQALADGDAPTALAYGTIPDGPRALLTSSVLQVQQRLAPIDDVSVRTTLQTGDRARVEVSYSLGFADGAQRQQAVVPVHRTADGWRLNSVAVATQVQLLTAQQRATLAGRAIPEGTTLLFPGAVPVVFDTPYLRTTGGEDAVSASSDPTTQVGVTVSAAGRRAALAAVRTALGRCLRPGAPLTCPLPEGRYVPGSLRGSVTDDDGLTVSVSSSRVGKLRVKGDVGVRGSYRRLEFDNTVTSRDGTTFRLPVVARTYATAPLRVTWDES
ncbi:hypothetical protein [Jatrophihabitans fulvus]